MLYFVHFDGFVADVMKDDSHMMKNTVERIKKIMGPARNYGVSPVSFFSLVITDISIVCQEHFVLCLSDSLF